ncbi:MAG: hypothetical protein WCI97_06355 [Bacteroidota bacterium]
MSLTFSNSQIVQQIVDLVESVSATEQKRMLYVLKLEKARKAALRLKSKSVAKKVSDKEIAKRVEGIRAKYGK